MASIRIEGVTKRFGNVVAVDHLDLEIHDKEFLVLLGPSGCGKSTTLNIIAGLEDMNEGNIYFDDQIVNFLPPHKRDVAMVFQSYALYPHKSVYDNIAFGLRMRRFNRQEIDRLVKHAADRLEISHLLQRRPHELSGGQRQRVALGRAIVRQPAVFLFDEPLSNLDAKLRVQMRVEIKKLQESLNVTSIYVTHDQVEAMTLGHRLLVMNTGVVEQIGTPLELYDRPATVFVAGFIGSPAMNFLDARIGAGGATVELPGGDSLALTDGGIPSQAGRAVTLGIRPEHLELGAGGPGAIALSVGVVEELGADTLIHGQFGTGGAELTVRLPGTRNIKPGEVLELTVDAEHLHLFDAENGSRLKP